MAGSSLRPSHTKSLTTDAFHSLDALILTSISTNPEGEVRDEIDKFIREVVSTLRRGGNVLVPIPPTGRIYDLFELVIGAITNDATGLSQDIPIYFISSMAESSLAFSNIYSEWLSDEKSTRVNIPEEPFLHSEFVRNGRIRIYDSLHGAFSRELRTPCILFTGHPSLRFGDVVHLLDLWGDDKRNAIMCLDPDFPLELYYGPFRSLLIRAYYFPVDTRLNFTHISSLLQTNIGCQNLIVPDSLVSSLSSDSIKDKLKFPSHISLQTLSAIGEANKVNLTSKLKSGPSALTMKRRVQIDNDLLSTLKVGFEHRLHCKSTALDLGIRPFTDAVLSVYDNDFRLKKRARSNSVPSEIIGSELCPLPPVAGRLTIEALARHLKKQPPNEMDVRVNLVETLQASHMGLGEPWSSVLRLPEHNGASVIISKDGRHSRILHCSNEKVRFFLRLAIRACLQEI